MIRVVKTNDGGIVIQRRDRFDIYTDDSLFLTSREYKELEEELAKLKEKDK